MELTHMSLFTGVGGIDIAAEAAGFSTIAQCEWADFQTKVLEARFRDVVRFRDIKAVTKEAVYERTGHKEITLISGGFPCQPFSCCGRRRSIHDDRYLWPEMYRVIKECRPDWVLGENVAGFLNLALKQTVTDLEKEGYQVRVFVLPAIGVGAWHERKRVFIIGCRVSHTACKLCRTWDGKYESGNYGDRGIKEDQSGWEHLGAGCGNCSILYPANSGMYRGDLPNTADGYGEISVDHRISVPQGADQPFLAGMADGFPLWLDGRKQWEKEPESISRVVKPEKNWADRVKSLGNAVVPQQVYPIVKAIADIVSGQCKEWCKFI